MVQPSDSVIQPEPPRGNIALSPELVIVASITTVTRDCPGGVRPNRRTSDFIVTVNK